DPRHRAVPQLLRGETPNPVDIPAGCRFRGRCPVAEDRCAVIDPPLAPPAGSTAAGHEVACVLT
ncbi:MAG TPA: oligopeptide/dipeptide ABC transporter ATP-binding protein, partial [Streptosporangiaceae bacterium]